MEKRNDLTTGCFTVTEVEIVLGTVYSLLVNALGAPGFTELMFIHITHSCARTSCPDGASVEYI